MIGQSNKDTAALEVFTAIVCVGHWLLAFGYWLPENELISNLQRHGEDEVKYD